MDEDKLRKLLLQIPKGKVCSYGELARALGKPKAARAVGMLLKRLAPEGLPCYRVIRADGTPGGYAFGKKLKIEKLKADGVEIKNGKVGKEFFYSFKSSNPGSSFLPRKAIRSSKR